jgi:hypothetical protein
MPFALLWNATPAQSTLRETIEIYAPIAHRRLLSESRQYSLMDRCAALLSLRYFFPPYSLAAF